MEKLKYMPMVWVIFKIGSSQAVGQIIGARKDNSGWFYNISNGASVNSPYLVKEDDIVEEVL